VFNSVSLIPQLSEFMKANLVKAAGEVIPDPKTLINIVSRRVKQLSVGHRAMVDFVPGLGLADIALSEIAAGKLSFESLLNQDEQGATQEVLEFPAAVVEKPKKKAA
jgi:DNA-directed RNA polymerase subunit omega